MARAVFAGGGGPIPVEVVETAEGWRLLRGGEPFLVKGAGWGTPIDTASTLVMEPLLAF